MAEKWSEIRTERPAGPLTGAEITVAVQGGQSVGLTYQQLKDWVKFKNRLDATTDPGVNDDSTAGYEPGSRWLNNAVSPKVRWICTDATAGAAVWDVLSLSEDELGSAALVNTGTGSGDVPLNSSLGSAARSNEDELPFYNWLGDHGRLNDTPGYGQVVAGSYQNNGTVMTPYNGSSVFEAGKFIRDNSDFGGSAGNMTQTSVDLINAMGRTGIDARYGVEFFIGGLTMGSGTAGPKDLGDGVKHLLQVSGLGMGAGLSNMSTVSFWLRAIDGPIYILRYVELYIDGVETGGDVTIYPADGWLFVRDVHNIPRGYTTDHPRIYAAAGDSIHYALPAKFPGRVDPGIYSMPIPGASAAGGL